MIQFLKKLFSKPEKVIVIPKQYKGKNDVLVEAIQHTGKHNDEILEFCEKIYFIKDSSPCIFDISLPTGYTISCHVTDYIIKVNSDYYVVPKFMFDNLFEEVKPI